MNRNVVGSIYGRSSTKIAHFVPIRSQEWPPQAILVSEWSISKKKKKIPSESACSSKQNERCTTAQPTEPFIIMLYSSHNKNWKIYWSKLVFSQRAGAHREDCFKQRFRTFHFKNKFWTPWTWNCFWSNKYCIYLHVCVF